MLVYNDKLNMMGILTGVLILIEEPNQYFVMNKDWVVICEL